MMVPEYNSPDRNYPMQRNANGSLSFCFTPSAKIRGEQIYRVKVKGQRKIGMTGRSVRERAYEYVKFLNIFDQESPSTPKIEIGRVTFVPAGEKIEDYERALIIASDSHIIGLNKNEGGGGGLTAESYMNRKRKENLQNETLPVRTKQSNIDPTLREPIHWWRCRNDGTIDLPQKVANYEGDAIYVFKTDDGRRLYGYTGQMKFSDRLNSYFTERSHPDLLKMIRENPARVCVALVEAVRSDQDLGDREKAYISAYNTKSNGYNRTIGGNGCRPLVRKRKRVADGDSRQISSIQTVDLVAKSDENSLRKTKRRLFI